MALSKITLKLGRKTIELTSEQFEELKQDMRDLDRSHNYYWHRNPWYGQWYSQPLSTVITTNLVGSTSTGSSGYPANTWALPSDETTAMPVAKFDQKDEPNPPAFSGSVLNTA